MKKHILNIIFALSVITTSAQIYPYLGIYNVDSCLFETPCHLVVNDTAQGNLWQRGAPDKLTFTESYTLPNAMVTDTANFYPPNADDWFTLKFDMYQYFYGMDIIIGFRHKLNTDTLRDGGFIETSYDGGITWYNIITDPNVQILSTENMYTQQDTLLGGIPGFSGYTADWVHSQVQIIYAFPVKWPYDSIYVRFHFISDAVETGRDGWMIDNIVTAYADLGGGIEDKNLIDAAISPNPVTGASKLTFNNPSGDLVLVEIINEAGQAVRTMETRDSQLIISKESLNPGLYLLKLTIRNKLMGVVKLVTSD